MYRSEASVLTTSYIATFVVTLFDNLSPLICKSVNLIDVMIPGDAKESKDLNEA